MDYDAVINTLTSWSQQQDNVRALLLTGSAATGQTHPLSDRDLEVYVQDPAPLMNDDSWWDQLGEVLVVERLDAAGWFPSRVVYYAGGKLDLTVIPIEQITSIPRDRSFRVLVTKDARTQALSLTSSSSPLPSADDFEQALHWGYAAALMCAKAAVRDELWMAKVRDENLKAQLLLLIEWDHRSRYGTEVDVRYLGTRMRQWMDQDVQAALDDCWGRFDAVDTAAALRASVALFARLATRLADQLAFTAFDHGRMRSEIEDILAMRSELADS
ncbi:aminoglycoside 6-adenylyltransferase [Kineococcus sp. SYSU DK003]|uniref:aminoglycoside 6-adenylyltransferase n=1 Tax=Kineococcus sp. SYSU DK003 TaxID=3383124 RepID=UPI003D7E675C